MPEHDLYEQTREATHDTLGPDEYASAFLAGRTLTARELVDFALDTAGVLLRRQRDPSGASTSTRLTIRELDVLRLIVDGKPDREIAAALFISPRTVTSHVTNILNKLGVNSRSAAAAYAVRHGLV
jgi:DNA-binding CsgD family transcriptional regulator